MTACERIGNATLFCGDALTVLATLPDCSVHCCVTSPPYWGLRDYGVDGQLGLESTPAEYVEKMVAVFREVKRVLRDDGTLWLNLGDSYAGGGNYRGVHSEETLTSKQRSNGGARGVSQLLGAAGKDFGLEPKNLVGIPWRVAFALQADGWYLRQDIIWAKPNPMPESVRDRCTKSHEYLFLFAKGQRVSRVIQCADLGSERFHFGQYIGAEKPAFRESVTGFCVALASAIFDSAQAKNNFSLPPFYAEEWKQGANGDDSQFVRDHPSVARLAGIGARFLCADVAVKEFVQQLDSLRLNLGNGDEFLKGWIHALTLAPSVDCDANGTVTVNDSGEVCKFEFYHNQIVVDKPTTCKYYFDTEAIAEPYAKTSLDRMRTPIGSEKCKDWGVDASIAGGGASLNNGRIITPKEARNKRSVWTVTTKPFKGAHFATFPPDLIEPCILAGCPVGGTVLDPFSGSGTSGEVALLLGRHFVGIELNEAYFNDLLAPRIENAQRQERLFA